MIPNHSLSTPNVPANYLFPDSKQVYSDLDFEHGGIALNDTSEGLQYQVWQLRLDVLTGDVWLSAENTPEFLLFNRPGTTDISLTFDQNMNPFVAFMQTGLARYWWFDPFTSQMEFVDMDPSVGIPKCGLDDKRALQTFNSDIILAYVKGGNLYYREERDRYTVEYLLKTGVVGDVIEVGMMTNLRVGIFVGVTA